MSVNAIARALLDTDKQSRLTLQALGEDTLLASTRELLQDMSSDTSTFFGRHGMTQTQLISELVDACAAGSLGDADPWLIIISVFGRSIALSEVLSKSGDDPSQELLAELRAVLSGNNSTANCLRRLYNLPLAVAGERLAWDTLELHRLGTTSIIFTMTTEGMDSHRLILKLSHVLFMSVGPVDTATKSYYKDWGQLSQRCAALASVWASGSGWIIEDFISGETLKETLARRSRTERGARSVDVIVSLFFPIIEALRELHSVSGGRGHGDLTPSNIMIIGGDDDRGASVVFIDMGRNLLASETIGRVTAAERFYVAPEVRGMLPQERSTSAIADIYSVGPLLANCLGYGAGDGLFGLDERIFAEQPEFARVSASCALVDPLRRGEWLLAAGADMSRRTIAILDSLRLRVEGLVETLRDIDPAVLAAPNGARLYVESSLGSWSKVVAASQRLYRRRRFGTNPGMASIGSWRIFLAAASFAFGTFLTVYSVVVDINWDPLGIAPLWNRTAFPTVSNTTHWEIRMVGATFLVACFQYNVCAFGWIYYTRCGAGRVAIVLAESFAWLLTVVVTICISVSLFVWPDGWILCSAVGVLAVAGNNVAALWVRESIARRSGLPQLREELDDRNREDILGYWTPTIVAYGSVLFIIAVLSIFGAVHDWALWALALSAVNLIVFSYSQATRQGFKIRHDLSRFIVAGELLRDERSTSLRDTRRRPASAVI